MYVIKFKDGTYYSKDVSWSGVELKFATRMKYREAEEIRSKFHKWFEQTVEIVDLSKSVKP